MEPDLQALDESLWDKYVEWCDKNNVKPKMDSFQIWKDEYGE